METNEASSLHIPAGQRVAGMFAHRCECGDCLQLVAKKVASYVVQSPHRISERTNKPSSISLFLRIECTHACARLCRAAVRVHPRLLKHSGTVSGSVPLSLPAGRRQGGGGAPALRALGAERQQPWKQTWLGNIGLCEKPWARSNPTPGYPPCESWALCQCAGIGPLSGMGTVCKWGENKEQRNQRQKTLCYLLVLSTHI